MVKVVAKNYVKKENVEKVLELCKELVEETRKEEGCIAYELFESNEDQTILTFIEEWTTQEALEAHFKSPHFVKIVPQLGDLMIKEGEVDLYSKKI